MNKEVIKELSAKAREAVATTRIVSGQREMTWLPEAFEEKFFQLATEWERKRMAWTQEHWTEYEHNIAAAAKAEEREQLLKLSTKAHDVDGHCDIVLSADIRARGETK